MSISSAQAAYEAAAAAAATAAPRRRTPATQPSSPGPYRRRRRQRKRKAPPDAGSRRRDEQTDGGDQEDRRWRRGDQPIGNPPPPGDDRNLSHRIYAESQAKRSFDAQSRQFDRGGKDGKAGLLPHERTMSNRRRARQARAARFRNSSPAASSTPAERDAAVRRGSSIFSRGWKPSLAELIDHVNRTHRKATSRTDRTRLKATALELARIEQRAKLSVREELREFALKDTYGHAPKTKPADTLRVIFENFNSLGVFATGKERRRKINKLNGLLKSYGADLLAGCECQTDWSMIDSEDDKFENLFLPGTRQKSVTAYNRTEHIQRCQIGGTAMATFGRMESYVLDRGVDETQLGRYCWTLLGGGGKSTLVVTVYVPGKPGAESAGLRAWDQQQRYFEGKGDARPPDEILREDLVTLILDSKMRGREVIVVGDFNESVYHGVLAQRFAADDLRLTEQCLLVNGKPLPATHVSGRLPIDGCFATAGITCVNASILPEHGGIGDHRLFVLDFTSDSVIGSDFPRVQRAPARKLNSASERLRSNYNAVLNQLCDRHKMFDKLVAIKQIMPSMTVSEFQLAMNRWDGELTDYMRASEKRCNQYRQCHIEWSPIVGSWLRRRWLLNRVRRYLDGNVKDARNLIRACLRRRIPDPRNITRDVLDAETWACTRMLERLKHEAPEHRAQHLSNLVEKAEAKGDSNKVRILKAIIKRERDRKQWGRVNYSTRKPRGEQVFSVKVPVPDAGDEIFEEYTTEDAIFDQVSTGLDERFRLAMSAPAYSGQLFDDIGFCGDTAAAQAILEGTYVFPPDCDPATRLLLEEAAKTYRQLSNEEIASYVTLEDFQYWWRRARARTSSSYSGLHFDHYIAAAYDDGLSALHAAKLTFCAQKGVPLERWGIGVTVLLEKICGNNFVNKLRAICLFEADFNWWQKLVFAKRMMRLAGEKSLIPDELFAKRGSHCNNATMSKTFFCDASKIMHHPAALEEEDFEQCYDRTAHPPQAIALRSWGVGKLSVRMLLTAIRRMQYCLKTGFGESEQRYGGTEDDPIAGSCQGSGFAPGGFSALSTLAVNAYRRLGHGAKLTSAYSCRTFLLAMIMYVDDTDALHWAPSPTTTDEELIAQVQKATDDWGALVHATGGSLGPDKCSLYLMCYRYVNGRAKLKSLRHLPPPMTTVQRKEGDKRVAAPAHVTIPRSDGTCAPIATLDVTQASKMLGSHYAPVGDGSTHIEKMRQKGLDWVDRIYARPLPSRDAWFSFDLQLVPALMWGLVSVILSPAKLEEMLGKLYYKALPLLGVNRNIGTEWRTLPECYHGLGLPNFVSAALAVKIHFLQCTWELGDPAGELGAIAYEAFIMEIGMYGNVFSLPYSEYEGLATDRTWWKNFWELLDHAGVDFSFASEHHLRPVREGDRAIMEVFVAMGFSADQLESLNVVRMYLRVVHLSDIVRCDGRTYTRAALRRDAPPTSRHGFPHQQPTRADFQLWDDALRSLATGTDHLPFTIGPFLVEPHHDVVWTSEADESLLYRRREHCGETYHDVFVPRSSGVSTRGRDARCYTWDRTALGEAPGTAYASVETDEVFDVVLHSTALMPSVEPAPTDFWSVIRGFENQSLFEHFHCDGDGAWIRRGLDSGSLVIGHDGSYMPMVTTSVCSAAFMIYCRTTKQVCKGTVVEYTESADNYRGEALGAIMIQLVLHAATRRRPRHVPAITIHCDNRGIIGHGNEPDTPLVERQPQADHLRALKDLLRLNSFDCKFVWAEGHAVDRKGWSKASVGERIIHKCDRLAKRSLLAGYAESEYISPGIPFERIRVAVDGERITGSTRAALDVHLGRRAARAFFDRKHIVMHENFDGVWWPGLGRALLDFPKRFRVWLTKHVAECCGTNLQLSYYNDAQSPTCPACDAVETTMHITRCQGEGRVDVLRQSVGRITEWMTSTYVDPVLVDIVERYLLGQGTLTMVDCLDYDASPYHALAAATDILQWDSFVEGRISTLWLDIMKPVLLEVRSRIPLEKWGRTFIGLLLQLTHKQWIYRNSKKHFRRSDGLTEEAHQQSFDRLEELALTDPSDLLPRHRDLLDYDFEALAAGSSAHRLAWISSMESALSAMAIARQGRVSTDNLDTFFRPRRPRRPPARAPSPAPPSPPPAPPLPSP